jgi:2-iminobutanoate/2-iminopropanoate deaminase
LKNGSALASASKQTAFHSKVFPDSLSVFLSSRSNAIVFERITLPDNLLHPVSPYCHAVQAGDFLFVTGQLAQEPFGIVAQGTVADQTHRVMQNLKLVLDHCGTGFDRVTMARIFLTDMRDLDEVNEIYRSYFQPDQLPGRTTIGVTGLAGLGDIEIDLIVYVGD